jgi:phytoene desaturase
MGLFVLYFGTKKLYPEVAHHSIWMGPRFKELLAEIFDAKQMSEDFSLYVHRPTATDKSFAPEDCESFYVLCPVPNLQGDVDWEKEAPILRDRIVSSLEETILPDLSSVIDEVFWMTPEDFARDYRSMHGAGFSIEPRLTQSAWFRFHNRDSAISNLYFVGAGTHPGAGLPGVVSSAKVVEELLTGVEVGSGG